MNTPKSARIVFLYFASRRRLTAAEIRWDTSAKSVAQCVALALEDAGYCLDRPDELAGYDF